MTNSVGADSSFLIDRNLSVPKFHESDWVLKLPRDHGAHFQECASGAARKLEKMKSVSKKVPLRKKKTKNYRNEGNAEIQGRPKERHLENFS